MRKTNKERILDYLWSIAPEVATNSQIRTATGISSHQQVYMLTQELMRTYIRGERRGSEWVFWAAESLAAQFTSPGRASPGEIAAQASGRLTPGAFEALAQQKMSQHFGVSLKPGAVPGVPKRFDLVSPDGKIVGDAKYFTLVRGERLPPAKFSVIAEHVWLLEKTGAPTKFLVFGNDRYVPELWLKRYGKLVSGLAFYFLTDDGALEVLKELEAQCGSDFERQVLRAIHERGLPLPDATQHTLYDGNEPIAVADFFYAPKILVFVDGSPHYRDYVAAADEARRRRLKAKGYRIVAIRADDVEGGLDDLAGRLRAR